MTERGSAQLQRSATEFQVGPSAMHWDGTALRIHINERTVPFPGRIQGQIRLHPKTLESRGFQLDASGHHHWQALAPCARIEIELTQPKLRWTGAAYFDSNWGDEPLEQGFFEWHWSRSSQASGTTVLYHIQRRDDSGLRLALRYMPSGGLEEFPPPPAVTLPSTLWQVRRTTQADPGQSARVVQTLEDTPFYARSVVTAHILGQAQTMMHESLSLDRFRSPWIQWMLPFRMPRNAFGGKPS